MNPLISILIPAYNAEAWIAESVESAIQQTWPRKEILIVDDGSTDRTAAIAKQYTSKNVSVCSQTNQGGGAARNRLLKMCQGDYIQWLDADDILAPDKVSRQVEAAGSSGTKRTLFSSSWGYFMRRVHRARFDPGPLWADLEPNEWLLLKLKHNDFMQTATWLVSRELTEAAGLWDTRLSIDQDGEYFCRVIMASDGVRFIPDAKVYYRKLGNASVSSMDRSRKKLESRLLSLKLHVEYLRSLEDSERTRGACIMFLQRWLVYYYPERPDVVAELQQLAASVDGELHPPTLPWKYSWIQKLFGWEIAKRFQPVLPSCKDSLLMFYDTLLFCLENRMRLQLPF